MSRFMLLMILLPHLLNAQYSSELRIVEKPIRYDAARTKLSVDYLSKRHGLQQSTCVIKPTMIVLHFTAGGTVQSVFNYFNQVEIEGARKLNQDRSRLNVSSHYLIDRDGTVYHLVPDTLLARHTIGLNYCAIGIENIGNIDQPLTKKQEIANAQLIRLLCSKYPIAYVIGHSEYGQFRNTPLWKEKDPTYFTHKGDPGSSFLNAVRSLIVDLPVKKAYLSAEKK